MRGSDDEGNGIDDLLVPFLSLPTLHFLILSPYMAETFMDVDGWMKSFGTARAVRLLSVEYDECLVDCMLFDALAAQEPVDGDFSRFSLFLSLSIVVLHAPKDKDNFVNTRGPELSHLVPKLRNKLEESVIKMLHDRKNKGVPVNKLYVATGLSHQGIWRRARLFVEVEVFDLWR